MPTTVSSANSNSTGAAYGVWGQLTGASNTGTAGYFLNSGGGAVANYGVAGITNATGAAYGVYGSITGAGNTGAAGNFSNTATTGKNNGVVAQIISTTNAAAAGFFWAGGTSGATAAISAENNSTGAAYGIYSVEDGHGNTGYAGYFVNTDTSVSVNYGVYGYVSATTTSGNSYPTGVYGEGDCANCIGVAGSSTNDAGVYATGGFAGVYAISPGTGTSYGVYGTITGANNTGYGGYFSNTATTGWAGYFNGGKLQVTNATAFNPTTMPIDSVVVGSASANGCAGDGVYMSDTTTVGDGQGFIAYLGGSTYIGQLQNGNCYLGITFSNNGYVEIWNGGPSATLDIGLNGTTTGNIRLEGKTSGYVQIQTANAAGNATFQLPSSNGTSGFVLSTDGTGVTSWVSNAGTASTALSGITVAAAAHTINNVNWAQTWNWNSLTTQTAMTFASSSLTTGNIVTIQNTAAAVTSTGKVLNISDATTGSGYGVYSSMTGHGNTGYAGYFINTDTSATTTNYGVYGYVSTLASSTSSNSAGVYGEGDCGSCAGVTGVSANNAGVSGSGDPGVYASSRDGSRQQLRHRHRLRRSKCHDRPRQHRLCRLLHQHRHEQQQQLRRLWHYAKHRQPVVRPFW